MVTKWKNSLTTRQGEGQGVSQSLVYVAASILSAGVLLSEMWCLPRTKQVVFGR